MSGFKQFFFWSAMRYIDASISMTSHPTFHHLGTRSADCSLRFGSGLFNPWKLATAIILMEITHSSR